MLLQRSTVSRKTPKDGKLEITAESSAHLQAAGDRVTVRVGDETAAGVVSQMECTCGGEGTRHRHHFIQSDLLKTLAPATEVELELMEGPTVTVRRDS